MSSEELVGMVEVLGQRGPHLRLHPVRDVAKRYQCVPPQVPGVPLGDVPTPVTVKQRVVAGREQVEEVDAGLAGLSVHVCRCLTARPVCALPVAAPAHTGHQTVGGTDLLAIVTAIDAALQSDAEFEGEDAGRLQ